MASSANHYQVPHHAVGWLLFGAFWIVLPTLLSGPFPLLAVTLGLLAWRWWLVRGHLTMPSRTLRVASLALVVALILFYYRTLWGPEAGVALVTSAFALKTLEMLRLRDSYVLLMLGYFVLAVVFLFDSGLFITLYVAAGFVIWTAAFIGINQENKQAKARQHIKLSLIMFLQALPLLVVIFVLVPRVGPLWGFGLNSDRAISGLTDTMSPGSITELSQSSDPAFRVTFEGDIPPYNQRYWRSIIYSDFDGINWKETPQPRWRRDPEMYFSDRAEPEWFKAVDEQRQQLEADYHYRVLMEPTGRKWLYTLDVAFGNELDVGMRRDFTLRRKTDVDQVFSYRADSYANLTMDLVLPNGLRQKNLALPDYINPQARDLAHQWYAESASDQAFIERVLAWFNQEEFYYTLQPGQLTSDDGIDQFLFESRRGFCAHYASAFAFMMRSVGVPARVVAGYQGGELNQLGNYLQVRQYDAHAWVEVWLEGQGWVRQDPTAAVAPSRIESGIFDALQAQNDTGSISSIAGKWQRMGLLTRLSLMSDFINYKWKSWVVDYNQDNQRNLFDRWIAGWGWVTIAMAAVGVFLLVMVFVIWWLNQQARKVLPVWQREYLKLYRQLEKRGLEVSPSLSPQRVVALACLKWPNKQPAFERWLATYTQLAYAPRPDDDVDGEKRLKRAWPL